VQGKSLVELLVRQGLARIKGVWANLPTGETAKAYVERLEALEREARQTRRGLWASAAEKLSAIPGERARLAFGGWRLHPCSAL
jgi:endonuclease YncB( thermonuclease family)